MKLSRIVLICSDKSLLLHCSSGLVFLQGNCQASFCRSFPAFRLHSKISSIQSQGSGGLKFLNTLFVCCDMRALSSGKNLVNHIVNTGHSSRLSRNSESEVISRGRLCHQSKLGEQLWLRAKVIQRPNSDGHSELEIYNLCQ